MKKNINIFLAAMTSLCLMTAVVSCGSSDNSNNKVSDTEAHAANMDLEERASRDSAAKSMPATTVEFDAQTYDFGTAKEGEVLKHTYTFKNTGANPYLISNVHTPCGCTEPVYSKKPVMPGETGSIEVHFNTQGKVGKNTNRPVTIYGNTEKEIVVTFNAEVIRK